MQRSATAIPFIAPPDVRLMNAVASTVYLLAAVGAVVAAVLWLMRSPLFPIRTIELDGDLLHNSVPTIRANAAPRLQGNFFSVDLQAARAAFEAVPWVRRAVVRRVWPDKLTVRLEEHRAAALWQGVEPGSDEKVVGSEGEVFDANLGDIEDDDLPVLSGPEGTAAEMLATYQRLQPVLEPLDWVIEKVRLSGRRSWRLELDNGAALEVGRGSEDELVERTGRFARTWPQVAARWQQQPLQYADLRHVDGYAVKLRGVSTTPANATVPLRAPAKAAAKKNSNKNH